MDGPDDDSDTIDLVLPAHLGPTEAESAATAAAATVAAPDLVDPIDLTDPADEVSVAAEPAPEPTDSTSDGAASGALDAVSGATTKGVEPRPTDDPVDSEGPEQAIDETDPETSDKTGTEEAIGETDPDTGDQPGSEQAIDETDPDTGDDAVDEVRTAHTVEHQESGGPPEPEARAHVDGSEPEPTKTSKATPAADEAEPTNQTQPAETDEPAATTASTSETDEPVVDDAPAADAGDDGTPHGETDEAEPTDSSADTEEHAVAEDDAPPTAPAEPAVADAEPAREADDDSHADERAAAPVSTNETQEPAVADAEPSEPVADAEPETPPAIAEESVEEVATDQVQPRAKVERPWSGAAAAKPLSGAVLTAIATVLGIGIIAGQILTDDEQPASPKLEVASSVSGAAPSGITGGDGTVFGIGEQGVVKSVSAAAAGRDLALGLLSTEPPVDAAQQSDPIVGGQISFSGGRLTGSLDVSAIDVRPVRLRLNVVDGDQVLAIQETMLRSTSATTSIMIRDGEHLLAGAPVSGAEGELVDIDWDLQSQRVPSPWTGSDLTTAELVLTVDRPPAPDSESAFVRYHERLGPLALDSSAFPSDEGLAFMAFQTSRSAIYETTSTDPETLGCILSSVSTEDEEVARFTPGGVTALAIPCLFSTQFATSPAGTAAATGLTGFIADPDAAVGCIAGGLGTEVTSLADYAALSSGDYTAWPQHLTDSYANVLEACIELRAFYLAQFEQYEYQRPSCPAEMTAYVLDTYSWSTFITSGILDADPALRQENQARFDSFISTGYASVGCYVSQPA